jgi:hypothetical protein
MTSAAFTKKIEAAFFLDDTVISEGNEIFRLKNVPKCDRR